MELLLDPAAALGAPLRGRVRLDGSAGRLRLSLLRFAVGPDARFDTATTVVTRLLLEEAAGVTEVPFELTPEGGPTSWSEGLVRCQWRLGVIFTRPDGRQEQASRAVEVGPYAGPPPDAAERAARLVEERLEVARDRYQSFYDRSWTLIWGAGAAALALPPALGALSMGPALAAARRRRGARRRPPRAGAGVAAPEAGGAVRRAGDPGGRRAAGDAGGGHPRPALAAADHGPRRAVGGHAAARHPRHTHGRPRGARRAQQRGGGRSARGGDPPRRPLPARRPPPAAGVDAAVVASDLVRVRGGGAVAGGGGAVGGGVTAPSGIVSRRRSVMSLPRRPP
jgi:hypothetical protein